MFYSFGETKSHICSYDVTVGREKVYFLLSARISFLLSPYDRNEYR